MTCYSQPLYIYIYIYICLLKSLFYEENVIGGKRSTKLTSQSHKQRIIMPSSKIFKSTCKCNISIICISKPFPIYHTYKVITWHKNSYTYEIPIIKLIYTSAQGIYKSFWSYYMYWELFFCLRVEVWPESFQI